MSTVAVEQALSVSAAEVGAELLRIREDQWFDRKSVRISAKDLAESLVAFANADGGYIVIGLWDGQVEGISRANSGRLSEWQQASFDFTVPSVPARSMLVSCTNAKSCASKHQGRHRACVLSCIANLQRNGHHRHVVKHVRCEELRRDGLRRGKRHLRRHTLL